MEYLYAQEEVKRIQSVPLVIGQFLEAVDQNYAIVGKIELIVLKDLYRLLITHLLTYPYVGLGAKGMPCTPCGMIGGNLTLPTAFAPAN